MELAAEWASMKSQMTVRGSSARQTATASHPSHDHGRAGSAAAPTVATASIHRTPMPTGASITGSSGGTNPASAHAGKP